MFFGGKDQMVWAGLRNSVSVYKEVFHEIYSTLVCFLSLSYTHYYIFLILFLCVSFICFLVFNFVDLHRKKKKFLFLTAKLI